MKRFVFLDFETTGLDEQVCAPIEVAVVVTDEQLNELGSYTTPIWPGLAPQWEQAAFDMHTHSGLASIAKQGFEMGEVGDRLVFFLSTFTGPDTTLHLAGYTAHFDRRFLKRYFPDVERMLHHRHLDVSSVRMLAEAAGHPPLGGEKPHRAMADVRRSLEDARRFLGVLRC